ncbi:MAG TPA: AAA family ATPase [Fimbriimonas sp.]|nr:AAA family ATPase [Fimbriimonas sp.]
MSPIFFISGCPGVGKSTTAQHLANRFEKAFRIDLDYFRQYVVKGLVQPSDAPWNDEIQLQFELAHTAAGLCARTYADAGFAVVIEHCSDPHCVDLFLKGAPDATVVCLVSDLETNLHRNLLRTNKSFDPKDIEFFVYDLNQSIASEFKKREMNVLDNTNLDVEAAVDAILALAKK